MENKKDIRNNFRNSVFERDGYKCKVCGMGPYSKNSESKLYVVNFLDAHHITDRSELPNGGYVTSNGISLCKDPHGLGTESCHMKAEKFHISGNKESHPNMHPHDLYILIGSSYEKAYQDSENLKS